MHKDPGKRSDNGSYVDKGSPACNLTNDNRKSIISFGIGISNVFGIIIINSFNIMDLNHFYVKSVCKINKAFNQNYG